MRSDSKESSTEGAAFAHALAGLRATGASVDTCELVEFLSRHEASERELISDYEAVMAKDPDGWARYLLELIVEDERRHHRLLAELATALAWGGLPSGSMRTAPSLVGKVDPEVLPHVRRLLKAEERDIHELRKLRRRFRQFSDTTMWTLIFDMMMLDTKKHATILRFLDRHLRSRCRTT